MKTAPKKRASATTAAPAPALLPQVAQTVAEATLESAVRFWQGLRPNAMLPGFCDEHRMRQELAAELARNRATPAEFVRAALRAGVFHYIAQPSHRGGDTVYLLIDNEANQPLARHTSYKALAALAHLSFANVETAIVNCAERRGFTPYEGPALRSMCAAAGIPVEPDAEYSALVATVQAFAYSAPWLDLPYNGERLIAQACTVSRDDPHPYDFVEGADAPRRADAWLRAGSITRKDSHHWVHFQELSQGKDRAMLPSPRNMLGQTFSSTTRKENTMSASETAVTAAPKSKKAPATKPAPKATKPAPKAKLVPAANPVPAKPGAKATKPAPKTKPAPAPAPKAKPAPKATKETTERTAVRYAGMKIKGLVKSAEAAGLREGSKRALMLDAVLAAKNTDDVLGTVVVFNGVEHVIDGSRLRGMLEREHIALS